MSDLTPLVCFLREQVIKKPAAKAGFLVGEAIDQSSPPTMPSRRSRALKMLNTFR